MRILALLVALLACAWFVVGIRQAHDTAEATAIISGATRPSSDQARHAATLLSSAKLLNPDTNVDVLRAQLERDQGHLPEARRILKRVVAKEPENVVAWDWLAKASLDDLRTFYIAAFHVRELAPPVPAHR